MERERSGNGLKVSFSWEEVYSMRLDQGKGSFSLTRFKRTFRSKVRQLIARENRDTAGMDQSAVRIEVGRVAVRQIDPRRPKDFLVDISHLSGGVVVCRETFQYVFENSGKSLNGSLVLRRRCNARK
jgi:hypothetical protein